MSEAEEPSYIVEITGFPSFRTFDPNVRPTTGKQKFIVGSQTCDRKQLRHLFFLLHETLKDRELTADSSIKITLQTSEALHSEIAAV